MFKVGLENNTEGRSQAWILGHPGCFAYGPTGDEALVAVREAIQRYRQWISSHNSESWFPEAVNGQDLYQLEESWECYTINDEYALVKDGNEIDAWFRHDWTPLSDIEIQRGLTLLRWGRDELIKVVGSLDATTLERTYPNERWSIQGILKHIGGAEWWYLDRLGLAFPRAEVPEEPLAHLEKVRLLLTQILPSLAGSKQVVGIEGEFWSPRKLLRRAVWHEYDHIAHIRKLL